MMEVFGIDSVVEDFARAASTIKAKTDDVVTKTKAAMSDTARDNAPVDDGELRDGIVETDDGVESTARHAIPVEYGTYKDQPQPYMDPAVDEHEPRFVEDLADAAGDI